MTDVRKLTRAGLILFLSLLAAASSFAAAPNITFITPPRQTVNLYQALNLTVTADVATSYQWYRNGMAISGATNSTYAITNATPSLTDGWYYVIVTNTPDSTTSAVIWVNVSVIPGVVTGYGDNSDGETTIPSSLTNVARVVGGGQAAVGLNADGTVTCWGATGSTPPDYGQSTVPGGLTNVVAIAAGDFHTLALTSDGTVSGWGLDTSTQTDVPALVNPVAIAAKGNASYALQADGTVVKWGAAAAVPSDLTSAVAITAGQVFAAALKSDGTVEAWGTDISGQTDVPGGLTGVVAIAAGSFHTLALKSDGTVVAWGDTTYGETTVPSSLTDSSTANVVAIAANGGSSYALKSDGTVVAWGNDANGEVTGMSALTKVVALGAGNQFSLAVQDGAHSADYTHDGKFSLPELLRVISLYNYSSGGTRTGQYHSQSGTVDGFAPGPGTLNSYHSADTSKDGKLSLPELLRVISLYNYSSGGTRTGQYHVQSSGTPDGFAPGP